MQFASIASGSSGNCLYTGNDDTHLLIDAGISKKRIEEGLNGFGVDPGDIDALLINEEPFTCSEFLAEMRGELVVRIDD